MRSFEAAQEDASGTRKPPEAAFRMDLRPDFQWPQVETARKEGDNGRRSLGVECGENQFLGGSDPTLDGFPAAQRLPAPGVATAQIFQQTCSILRQQSL